MATLSGGKSGFWKSEHMIAQIPKGQDVVRITVSESHGGDTYINIRLWYQDATNEWKPGKQGITLDYETADEVYNALNDALDFAALPTDSELKSQRDSVSTESEG